MRFVQTLSLVFFVSWIVNSSISTSFKRYFDNSAKGEDVKVTLYGRVFCAEVERQNATNTTTHTRHRRHISLEELYSAHGYSSSVRSDDDLFDNSQTMDAVMKQPGNDRILRSNRGQLRRQHQDHFGDGRDSHNGETLFRSYGFEDSDEGGNHPPRRPSPHQHNSWEHQPPPQKRQPLRPLPPQHHEESSWDSSQSRHKPPHHPQEESWKPSKPRPRPPQNSGEVSWGPSSNHPRPGEHHEDTFWSPSQSPPRPPQHHQQDWNPSHSPSHKLIRPNNHGSQSGEWLPEPRPEPRPRPPSQTPHSSAEGEEWSGSMQPRPASPHVPQWSGESMAPLRPKPQAAPKPQAQEEKDWSEPPQRPMKPAGIPPSQPMQPNRWEDRPMRPPHFTSQQIPNSGEIASEGQATNENQQEDSAPIPSSWESVPSRSPSKPARPSNSWENADPQQPPHIQRRPQTPEKPANQWPSKQTLPFSSNGSPEEVPSNAVPTTEENIEDSPITPEEIAAVTGGKQVQQKPSHINSDSGRHISVQNQQNDQTSAQIQNQNQIGQRPPQSPKLPPTTEAEMDELMHSRGKGGWDADPFVASGAGLTRAELEARKRAEEQNEEDGNAPKFAQAISRRSASRRWRRSAAIFRSPPSKTPKIKLSPAKNAVITVYQPVSLGNGFVVNEPIGRVETDEDGYFHVNVVLSDYFMNVVMRMKKPFFTITHTCNQNGEELEEPCRYVSYLPLLKERDLSSSSHITEIEPASEVSKVVVLGVGNDGIPTSKRCPYGNSKDELEFLRN
ncbi:hypothetical protein Ddc_02868 [Ditylenchus destructor]|nr:hypothetical protein Ddc_02868 [Ditylenchus destructor]